MRPEISYPFAVYSSRLPARTKSVVVFHKQSASARDAQDQKTYRAQASVCSPWDCAMGPHTGLRVGVDEDGRRTWRPVHRVSSSIARWLLFVVKAFSNGGSRRMRSTPRHARAMLVPPRMKAYSPPRSGRAPRPQARFCFSGEIDSWP